MRANRKVNRRSFLGTVAGGMAVGPLGLIAGASRAEAQDASDTTPYHYGDNSRQTGPTPPRVPNPSAPYQPNPPPSQPTGCSDNDPMWQGGDAPYRGVRCGSRAPTFTGCNDSDPTDAIGYGRFCRGGNVQEQQQLNQYCRQLQLQFSRNENELRGYRNVPRWSAQHFQTAQQVLGSLQGYYREGGQYQYSRNPQWEAQMLQYAQRVCAQLRLQVPGDNWTAISILSAGINQAWATEQRIQQLQQAQQQLRQSINGMCPSQWHLP
jgi:hypothetical protein